MTDNVDSMLSGQISFSRKLNRTLYDGKWLRLIEYDVKREQESHEPFHYLWESVERTTRKGGSIDACDVVAVIASTKEEDEPNVLLVIQYRAPVDALCCEFPAGLVDEGESVEKSAIRELKEETGYDGNIVDASCEIYLDPALSNENAKIITIEIDTNEAPSVPQLDAEESITCVKVPMFKLYDTLIEYQSKGMAIDARLFSWAHGVKTAMQYVK